MGALYGQQSTLTALDSDLKINIEDLITKYPDRQFPALKRMGAEPFKSEVLSHKYIWKEREDRPIKSTYSGANVASGATSIVVDTPGVFNKDDVVQVVRTGEQFTVDAVAGGVSLTIANRGLGGTTAAGIVASDVLVRVGVAAPQGADGDSMVITDPTELYNYTQIFEDVVELTGTQHRGMIHGDENSTQLIARKQKELMEVQQLNLFFGQREISQASKKTFSGGIKFMIDTYASDNAINFGGLATWSSDTDVIGKMDDAVEKIVDYLGDKPTIYAGFKAIRKLRLVQDDTVRTTYSDKSRGIGVIDTWRSQIGDLDIVQIKDRSGLFDSAIFFVDESLAGYKAMKGRGWFTTPLAKNGDSYRWQVLGEYTNKLSTPKVASYIYNLGI